MDGRRSPKILERLPQSGIRTGDRTREWCDPCLSLNCRFFLLWVARFVMQSAVVVILVDPVVNACSDLIALLRLPFDEDGTVAPGRHAFNVSREIVCLCWSRNGRSRGPTIQIR